MCVDASRCHSYPVWSGVLTKPWFICPVRSLFGHPPTAHWFTIFAIRWKYKSLFVRLSMLRSDAHHRMHAAKCRPHVRAPDRLFTLCDVTFSGFPWTDFFAAGFIKRVLKSCFRMFKTVVSYWNLCYLKEYLINYNTIKVV